MRNSGPGPRESLRHGLKSVRRHGRILHANRVSVDSSELAEERDAVSKPECHYHKINLARFAQRDETSWPFSPLTLAFTLPRTREIYAAPRICLFARGERIFFPVNHPAGYDSNVWVFFTEPFRTTLPIAFPSAESPVSTSIRGSNCSCLQGGLTDGRIYRFRVNLRQRNSGRGSVRVVRYRF